MSLSSYLVALRASAALPRPIREQAMRLARYDSNAFGEDADVREPVDEIIMQVEQFTAEASTSTLADRSVLTLAGLADIRLGTRLHVAASAAEDVNGIAALAPAGRREEFFNCYSTTRTPGKSPTRSSRHLTAG